MRLARDFAYCFVMLVCSPVLFWRVIKHQKYRNAWRERQGHVAVPTDEDNPTILLHAVSVGEVNATLELVNQLESEHGNRIQIIISVTTDTGTARAQKLYAERHTVVRFPLDFSWCVRLFLDRVQPDLVVLMELELWPNFVEAVKDRGLPLLVINGRLSERSHRRYRWIRPLVRSMFAAVTQAGVQDEVIRERFVDMGADAERVIVTGSMKWDTAKITDDQPGSAELAERMGLDAGRPLVVCGSTGPGEEAMICEALQDWVIPWGADSRMQRVQVLVAPRKPERFEEAAAALPGCVRWSQRGNGNGGVDAEEAWFLLDTIGELKKAYALADAVVVGRSFCDLYGSDMMEPISLGKAVVIGPNTSDFAGQMTPLLAGGGIIQLDSVKDLRETLESLMTTDAGRELTERGREVISQQQGATARHREMID